MQGELTRRSTARFPVTPLATTRTALPHGRSYRRSVARKAPERPAFVVTFIGPSGVAAVSVTRSPGRKAEPTTTSGCVPATRRRGDDDAVPGVAMQTAATAATRDTTRTRIHAA